MRRFFTKKSVASFFLFLSVFSFFYLVPTNAAHAGWGWDIVGGLASKVVGFSNLGGSLILQTVLLVIGSVIDFIFIIVANIFDIAIKFSIFNFKILVDSSSSLNGIWILFRDIVNIGFIFVLLYIAIKQILSTSGASEKKLIGALIFDAVFVNFSMFIFKLIIDFGNIIATAIYNQINGGGSISAIITTNLGLGDFLKNFSLSINPGQQASVIIIMLLKIIIMGTAVYVFVWAIFIFVGRAVKLLYLIITSPIAFSGNALPALKGYQGQHWKDLLHQTFLAPVFLLFMLIVARVLSAASLAGAIAKSSEFNILNISGYFYYLFGIYFLMIGLNKTKELSGDVADMTMKVAKGVGIAIAAAFTGGAALTVGGISAISSLGSTEASKAAQQAGGGLSGLRARLSFGAGKLNENLVKKPLKLATGEYNERPGLVGMAGRFANTGFKAGLGNLGKVTGGIITEKGIKEEMERKKKETTRVERELAEKAEALRSTDKMVSDRAQAATEKELKMERATVDSDIKSDKKELARAKRVEQEARGEVMKFEKENPGQPVPKAMEDRADQALARLDKAQAEFDQSAAAYTKFMERLQKNYLKTATDLGVDINKVQQDLIEAEGSGPNSVGPKIKKSQIDRLKLGIEIQQGSFLAKLKALEFGAATDKTRNALAQDLYKNTEEKKDKK